MNIYQCLETGFPSNRTQPCMEIPEGRIYSWRELEDGTARIAALLTAFGLPPDARVASAVEKSPEALMLYLATVRAGFVFLPLNTAYQSVELEYFLNDATPAVVVCPPEKIDWIAPMAEKAGAVQVLTLNEDGEGSLMEAAAEQSPVFETVPRDKDDLAAILYTSGTTGRSKGAMLTHENLTSNALVLKDFWDWRSEDVLLHMLPIFHVHGLFVACHGALLAGAKMVWLPKFDAAQAVELLPRCTVMMGVPTFYVRLLAREDLDRSACGNMRIFISGSAPLLPETFLEFQKRTGHTILERYGMSETTMLVSNPCRTELGPRIGGTVGQPLPGVSVRVVGSDGKPCDPGEVGEIQVKGPCVFKGYWKMPEKTKEEFTEDAWFKTGDLGCWGGECDGKPIPETYLSIVGRGKDLIISGGFNVYPKEIEGYLNELPEVNESAVIGAPHPDFGEVVVAVVVPKNGPQPDPEKLIADMKARVANFKVPKKIHFVDSLPRNAMGKVQKNLLRKKFAAF